MKRLVLSATLAALLTPLAALAQGSAPDATSTLLSVGVALLPFVLAGLVVALVWVLAAWRQKLQVQAGESRLAQVGARILLVAEGIVRDLEVTLKPKLKEATADGVLTRAELELLKSEALKQLKDSLGEHGLSELREVLQVATGSLGVMLSGIIETALDRMKAGKASSASAHPLTLNLGPGAEVVSVGSVLQARIARGQTRDAAPHEPGATPVPQTPRDQ